MATPSEGLPEWGTNQISEVIDGKTYVSKVAPPPEVKLSGIKYQEPMARSWFNYQFNLIRKWIEELDFRTSGGTVQLGWFTYSDTIYTSGAPFTVTAGSTEDLPNNGGSIVNSSAPTNGDTFYDGTKITPNNLGDAYHVSIRFDAESTTPSAAFIIQLDIGDGITPKIVKGDGKTLIKGVSVTQPVEMDFLVTSIDPDFITNGGKIQIEAVTGNIDIYNITYTIQRTFYKDNS